MVTQVVNMSRNGVSDWLIQRVSALVLAAYTLCIFGYVVLNPGLDFETWSGFFNNTGMQVFTMLAVLSTGAHAWIGMWTVATDYLTTLQLGSAATFVRLAFQLGCAILITVYLLWGIQIFWGS